MTHILFWPNPHSLIWQDDPRPVQVLLALVQDGKWQPPAPFPMLPAGDYLATLMGDTLVITQAREGVPPPRLYPLGQRQTEILRFLSAGATTRQIAQHLRLTPRTILYHIAELKQMFGAQTRAELVANSRHLVTQSPHEEPQ